jgi:hypothetical protein
MARRGDAIYQRGKTWWLDFTFRGERHIVRLGSHKEVHEEFEGECPGYCGAQDTFYVGTLKGVESQRSTQ